MLRKHASTRATHRSSEPLPFLVGLSWLEVEGEALEPLFSPARLVHTFRSSVHAEVSSHWLVWNERFKRNDRYKAHRYLSESSSNMLCVSSRRGFLWAKMKLGLIFMSSIFLAVPRVSACSEDNRRSDSPSHSKRTFPPETALPVPTRPLQWGDVNFLHTTVSAEDIYI